MVDECTVSSGTTSSVTEKLLQPGVAGYHQPAISAICDPRTARPEYAGAGGAKERSSSERSSPRQRAKCLATKAHSLPQCNINTTRNSTCPTWQPLGRQTAVAAAAANSDSGTANCRCRNRASKDVILETTCQRSRVASRRDPRRSWNGPLQPARTVGRWADYCTVSCHCDCASRDVILKISLVVVRCDDATADPDLFVLTATVSIARCSSTNVRCAAAEVRLNDLVYVSFCVRLAVLVILCRKYFMNCTILNLRYCTS